MKALVLEQPGKFIHADLGEPGRPGADDAVVRVHRVGICGSDISGFLGKMPFYSYPRIPGHELGVEVVEVGSAVSRVRAGDRCSVEPYMNCRQCLACRRGASNCCQNLKVLGVHTDGGLRPRFIVPARKLHKSNTLTLDQLALVETLAIGCHAVNRASPQRDEHVLVIGAGPIGLSVIEFVKLTGATLTVLDLNDRRLAFCRETMGVKHTVLSTGDRDADVRAVQQVTGEWPTVVIDATGSPNSMNASFHFAGHTGRIVFVGIGTFDVSFPDPLLHARELTLYASRNALPADFERIIRLIEDGRIDTRPWITHRCSFDEVPENFPAYTKPETGVIKAMVELE